MTVPRKVYAAVTESAFQEQVFQLLHLNGWKVAHFRVARVGKSWMTPVAADGKGWPDLFCVHAATGDRLAVEMKAEYRHQEPHQVQWQVWLEACGIEYVVWRPSMIDAIITRLRKTRDEQRGARASGDGAVPAVLEGDGNGVARTPRRQRADRARRGVAP